MLARCLREKLRKFKDRALWTGQRGSDDRLTVMDDPAGRWCTSSRRTI